MTPMSDFRTRSSFIPSGSPRSRLIVLREIAADAICWFTPSCSSREILARSASWLVIRREARVWFSSRRSESCFMIALRFCAWIETAWTRTPMATAHS